jgi:hypothetical protein
VAIHTVNNGLPLILQRLAMTGTVKIKITQYFFQKEKNINKNQPNGC